MERREDFDRGLELVSSGRLLTAAVKVEERAQPRNPAGLWRRWVRGSVEAVMVESTRQLASVESRLLRSTEIVGVTRLRETWVRLSSGARWSVATEPDPASVRGRRARTRRIVVRDDLDRVSAVATPLQGSERRNAAREEIPSPFGEVAGHFDTALASGRGLLQASEHRTGRSKWLVLGAALLFWAFGGLIASLALAAGADPGQGIGVGIASLIAGVVGWRALRRWRDPSRCWSCGESVDVGVLSCPECDAPKPSSAGWSRRARGPLGSLLAAGGSLARGAATGFERSVLEVLTIRVDGAHHRATPKDRGWSIDGVVTVARNRDGEVTIVPEKPVPLELALVLWHLSMGDVREASAPGGGG